MPPCIFCAILAGEAPAEFIDRDDFCAAFLDIHPVNPGHVLVVPLAHSELLASVEAATLGHMFRMAQRLDSALRLSGLPCEGVNLFLADGRPAGQEVLHVHLHVIPRYRGDGHHLRFSPEYFKLPSRDELRHNAELLRKQLGGQS
ncbi:MAG: HIT family protein [Anaerolineales bacterium]|nr:HIT family protein [Anaerolineae bacterium]PWB51402.1 MAG: HIT family protein [Anaerolineales bacterium]